MPWDFQEGDDRSAPKFLGIKPADPRDLETIVTLLEVAAIFLTPKQGSSFTKEELLIQAQILGGEECRIREDDFNIVFPFCGHLFQKLPGSRLELK
jgi:hypothetical protein